jgi:hypothetical protein
MSKLTYYFMPTGGVGLTPDGTIPDGAVICTQAQYENPQQYYIDSSTQPPTIKPIAEATALQLLQAAKIMKISQACNAAIYSGYQSRALGSPYLYPSKATDQMNMLSSLMDAMGAVLFDADPWTANTDVVEGQCVWINKQLYVVTQNGKTGDTMPLWPLTGGAQILDGSAIWEMWTTPFWCADLSVNPPSWMFRSHTLRQIWQVGKDAKQAILTTMGMNMYLGAEVEAAQTAAQVAAINWPSS